MITSTVLRQHANEAAHLYVRRRTLTTDARATLHDLGEIDERLAAHLDGVLIGGEAAWKECESGLEDASAGVVFVAAVKAIEERQPQKLDVVQGVVQALPAARAGFTAALGWLERGQLYGVVAPMLRTPNPFLRASGIAACAMHGVDPGIMARGYLRDADPTVRARALRAVGELGRGELAGQCAEALGNGDESCQHWAAWSAVLLGDRRAALQQLTSIGLAPGPFRTRALDLAVQAMTVGAAHRVLQQLASDPADMELLIQASGIAGDPAYIPWLIGRMTQGEIGDIAADAFRLITGTDVPLVNVKGGTVPDVDGLRKWWGEHGSAFKAGTRYFGGAPVTSDHCVGMLATGSQRERILAARYLCLLSPGTPVFSTSAPAWRQQRQLAEVV